jgi:hypothetical protein
LSPIYGGLLSTALCAVLSHGLLLAAEPGAPPPPDTVSHAKNPLSSLNGGFKTEFNSNQKRPRK